MKIIIKLILVLFFISCSSSLEKWKSYNESEEISKNSSSENQKLRYKRIQSISTDKNILINGCSRGLGYDFFEHLKSKFFFNERKDMG